MKIDNQTVWLAGEGSLANIFNLQKFMHNPTKEAAEFYSRNASSESSEQGYDGIGAHLIRVYDNVGVVVVKGDVSNDYSYWNKYFGVVSYEEIHDALITLANDTRVKAVVISAETGGGSAAGLTELSATITQIQATHKPIYGHVPAYALSAGMWILAGCKRITASPMAQVGSIGVVVTLHSMAGMYEKAGLEFKVIRAGKFKALANPLETISDAAITEAETKSEQLYGYFLRHISSNRPALAIANKDTWAEGKTFFAEEAVKFGMIDSVETFDKVVANLNASHNNTYSNSQFSAASTEITLKDGGELEMATRKTLSTPQLLAAAALGVDVSADVTTAELVDGEETTELVDGAETTELVDGAETTELAAPAETVVPAEGFSVLLSQNTELVKANAKLELKIETLELAAADKDAEGLLFTPIITMYVQRMEVALGMTPSDCTGLSGSVLAAKCAKLDTTFRATFSLGAASSPAAEPREQAENITNEFHTIHKPK
jgi:signal peptide peptidase SppA